MNNISDDDVRFAMQFFDRKFPAIRQIYTFRFEEAMSGKWETMDRKNKKKIIDELNLERYSIYSEVSEALQKMNLNREGRCSFPEVEEIQEENREIEEEI
ncbi:unnamed protein product [Caenorhabditis angaria]|uniref:Uncharacterized protein n=1 Tax=Caenorhabditis angaria TaxID=860376 RepID=A0A9P1N0S4_9PELO|nr:unnamed protein product [Caenorhabditis angaria]